jgi:PTH1 family peptidyl-tRNA hydrolase
MKLVAGLGNPGQKHEGTRHNVGYLVLDELASRFGGKKDASRFHGLTATLTRDSEKVLLLWPITYMNLSGKSVLAARDFYQISDGNILVVCDDFNLPLGRLRVRARGSAGGQKGLADVIHRLGTDEISRVRIGIGPVPASWDPADFVLGRFGRTEREEMELAVPRAADAVLDWVTQGVEFCMNKYNAGPTAGGEQQI